MAVLNNAIQSIPTEICKSLSRFQEDHADPRRYAFVMMRFQSTDAHRRIMDGIKYALKARGIEALRADDRGYHSDLYWNILTYIYGCSCGVAVFERIEEDSFNPNIAFEVGYMLALGKPVCLLKERTLRALHTDLAGKLYNHFDGQNCKKSIRKALQEWLADQDVGLPIKQTKKWIKQLDRRECYQNWSFRVNWPLSGTGPRVDGYSPNITCEKFLKALISPKIKITRQEFDSVFNAMKRATDNEVPPKKLSGDILFAETSRAVLNGIQGILGSTPYERPKERHGERRDVLDEPSDLFPPFGLFCIERNIEKYKCAQKRIAKTSSQICKNVLCSTYQISISQALYWKDKQNIDVLAMVCTATNSSKEHISPVSEIPVIMKSAEDSFIWFGQPERKPTTEYQSHWCFHRTLCDRREPEHILIHFHPVLLLEAFETLQNRYGDKIPSEFLDSVKKCAEQMGITLFVFLDYMQTGARDPVFGGFIASAVKQRSEKRDTHTLIWKPDHGLWLTMYSNVDIEEIREALEKTEVLSGGIAKVIAESDPIAINY